jgi:uncharacterized SAM-binding protein YcdF (DUF218 family)
MWTIHWIKIYVGILIVFCALFLFLYSVVSMYDKQYADGQRREAAIVLGAALWENNPSPTLRERLDIALQLYRSGKIDIIILSGGLGKWGVKRTEAEAMKEYLHQHNVPAEKMILEKNSHNTKENLQNTAKLLRSTSISNLYLVTHDYHMTRALMYAKQAGLTVSPAPAHTTELFLPYHKLRECIALVKLYLFDQND